MNSHDDLVSRRVTEKEKMGVDENCEGCCFACKGDGSFLGHEFKNCPKAYHAGCVGSLPCDQFSNLSGSSKHGDETEENKLSISPLQREERSNDQVKIMKKEYIGWGSKALIDFLVSIGKDTSKEIPQLDVASIINKYIYEKRLLDAQKKRTIMCDEKLIALFGKKKFLRNKVYDLLELHYRENAEFYEKDRQDYRTEEKNESSSNLLASKKQKKTGKFSKPDKKVVLEAPRSRFASIIADNIKLIYLNRSVVVELSEDPENFESMVMGSFVKVKSDPHDHMQKTPNQLVIVTGVKNIVPGGKKEDILLQVSNKFDDFSINMLSDGNFSKEECEDLSQRVKIGQLRKLTVVEIEEKAKTLHRVIMKHWIVRELGMLQIKIDQANERGMRKELFQFMERRELLKTEAEQKRILEEVPKAIAELLDTEIILNADHTKMKQGDDMASSGYKAGTEDNTFSGNAGSLGSFRNCTARVDEALMDIQEGDESNYNGQCGDILIREPRQCEAQMQSQCNNVEEKMARTEKSSHIDNDDDDDDGDNGENICTRSLLESVLRCIPSTDLLLSSNMVTSHPSHPQAEHKKEGNGLCLHSRVQLVCIPSTVSLLCIFGKKKNSL